MAATVRNTTNLKGSFNLLTTENGEIPEYLINGVPIPLSGLTGVTFIESEADWIEATTDLGGDIRQMVLNQTYIISGVVTHGFSLRANGINRITSESVISASNDYTGPNNFGYECVNISDGISFDNMTVNCPGKDWMQSTSALFVSTDRCSIQCLGIGLCNALIIFFAFTRFGNTGAEFTSAMNFTSTSNVSIDITNCAYFPNQATANLPCIDLNLSTWGDVRIESNKFNLGGTNFFLAGLASGGNLINAGFVNHCDTTGSAAPVLGVSPGDDPWVFTGNLGVADSTVSLGGFVAGNTAVTTISAGAGDDGNPIQVNLAALATTYKSERMTMSSAGLLTYVGDNPTTRTILFTGIADAAAGNNIPYTFYVAQNGVVIEGSRGPVSLDSADPGRFAAQAIVDISNTDTLALFVEENSGTTNITITDLSIVES